MSFDPEPSANASVPGVVSMTCPRMMLSSAPAPT
jgi:hypothetical protein